MSDNIKWAIDYIDERDLKDFGNCSEVYDFCVAVAADALRAIEALADEFHDGMCPICLHLNQKHVHTCELGKLRQRLAELRGESDER